MGFTKDFIRSTATQALSAGSLSHTYTAVGDTWLHNVMVAFSGAVSETVTVKFDSVDGSTYDVTLDASTLSSESNYVFNPAKPFLLRLNDAVTITVTNGGGVQTAYLTAFLQRS